MLHTVWLLAVLCQMPAEVRAQHVLTPAEVAIMAANNELAAIQNEWVRKLAIGVDDRKLDKRLAAAMRKFAAVAQLEPDRKTHACTDAH